MAARRARAPALEERDKPGERASERDKPHRGGDRVVVDGDERVADRAGDSPVAPAVGQAQFLLQSGCSPDAALFEGREVLHGLGRKLVLAGNNCADDRRVYRDQRAGGLRST